MNAEERAVIDGIFDRLKNVAGQQRDVEAERHIAERIREQPYAPYALAQSVYVQEQALINQQQEIERLQAELAEARKAAPQPQAGQSGGFLSGLFGGGAAASAAQPPAYGQRSQAMAAAPQQGGPWSGQPAPQPQQPAVGPWGGQAAQPQQKQGMGFLGTAAAAAAGVAGGMMIGNLLSSAFGGGQAHAKQPAGDFTGQQGGAQGFFDSPGNSAAPDDEEYEDEADDTGGWGDDGGDTYEA